MEPPSFDSFPVSDYIPAKEVESHLVHERETEKDAKTINRLREMGVAAIRGEYWGGFDQANYELKGLYNEDGESVENDPEISDFLDEEVEWRHRPAVIAVDQGFGGGFTGAGGGGGKYGGVIEMRLDTLETRKIDEFHETIEHDRSPDAPWTKASDISVIS